MFRPGDYLSELLTEGPPSTRCELIRPLPSDDFGPRVLARRRSDDQAVIVRGMAIADAAWARTVRRLQAIAGIQGEHVTPLVAYGRHAGLAYFVHEHDGGPRLTSLLEQRDGRMALSALLPVFAQLLVALGEAHRRGVVVGGVRPQDVRVIADEGGAVRIRLLDLGFASVLGVPAGRRGATDHPAIYRAPETDVAAHPASDVFSLGVLFVRMLTGPLPRPTCDAERIELLRARLAQAHRDDPSFSDGLYTLLSEVIDPDLATRPRDAQRLLEAMLEVVPASALRLPGPSAAARLEPFVAEDGAPIWPARQWTVLQSWDQPRRPTPSPARVAAAAKRSVAPRRRAAAAGVAAEESMAGASATAEAFTASSSVTAEASAETSSVSPSGIAPVIRLVPRPAPRRRGLVSRVALGAAFLATGTALGLAIAVGEPGATAATAAATSITAIADIAEGPAAPAPTGSTLVVETTPPGVLTIDGQRVGSTPYLGSLLPGAHVVRVESPGHQAWRSRIELLAGQSRHVSVSLEPVAASTELARASAVTP